MQPLSLPGQSCSSLHTAVPAQMSYKFNLENFFVFSPDFVIEREVETIGFPSCRDQKRSSHKDIWPQPIFFALFYMK